jgi:hypothetical protein
MLSWLPTYFRDLEDLDGYDYIDVEVYHYDEDDDNIDAEMEDANMMLRLKRTAAGMKRNTKLLVTKCYQSIRGFKVWLFVVTRVKFLCHLKV